MVELKEVGLVELVDLTTSENDPIPNFIDLTVQDSDEECQIIYETAHLEATSECSVVSGEKGPPPRTGIEEVDDEDVEVLFDDCAVTLKDVKRTSVLLSYGSEDECVEIEAVDDVGEIEYVDVEAVADIGEREDVIEAVDDAAEREYVDVEAVGDVETDDDVDQRDDSDAETVEFEPNDIDERDDETVGAIEIVDEDPVQEVNEILEAVSEEVNPFEEDGFESFEEAHNAGALCQLIDADGARHAVTAVQDNVDEAEEIPNCDKTTESAGMSPLSQRLADFKNEEYEPTGSEQWGEDETGNEHHGEPYRCEDVPQLAEEGRSSPLLEESREDPVNEPSSSSSSTTSRNSSTWNSKCTWDSPEGVADFTRRFQLAYNYVVMNSQAEMQNEENSNRSSFIDGLRRSPRISRKISGVVNSTTGATKRNRTVERQDSEYSDSE